MNERIKELEDWASQYASRETTDLDEWEFIFRKKFAELIVQECAEWMDAEQDEKGDGISDNFYWSARMRKHFGVK